MKRFGDLNETQQAKAIEKAIESLLEVIMEGAIRFNDELNCDDLQARIDAAFAKAEAMRTPWFAGEYIMETCGVDIRSMAQCDAEDTLYSEPGETVRSGVAV